ncbi:MAG: 1,4-dihydroxy-6-naphthoate synthase [Sediminibacterium sp.]|nr:1,4-dihydroxy-6-naphthoate synthase [Sediminibacterium sp.]
MTTQQTIKINLAISPCPNDTFIFDALINHKIPTKNIEFKTFLADIESLNVAALNNTYSVTKISYAVWPKIKQHYLLLKTGSALGQGVGPLLISKNIHNCNDLAHKKVGLPGLFTTAHQLFSKFFHQKVDKIFLPFNELEPALDKGLIDAAVIIHEGRFTYPSWGFHCLADLGLLWEQQTNLPLPLGGIVIQNSLKYLAPTIEQLICESLAFAYKNHYHNLAQYVIEHAQEMEIQVIKKHIDLYVNQYSYDYKEDGFKAIEQLCE